MIAFFRDRPLLGLSLLTFIVVAALFSPSIFNDFVNWDDPFYLTENAYVHHPEQFRLMDLLFTPRLGYPLPLQVSIYRALHWMFGLKPLPFHLFNVLVHALSSALLVLLFGRFFRPGAAWIAALIFALHPIAAEPVAWVTGSKDLLVVLFSILTLLTLFEALKPTPRPGTVLLLLTTSTLAILSKPTAVSLIPVLITAALLFGPIPPSSRRGIVITLTSMLLLWIMLATAGTHGERNLDAIAAATDGKAYLARILHAALIQLRNVFFPVSLFPSYPFEPTGLHVVHLISGSVAVGILGIGIHAVKTRRKYLLFFIVMVLSYYGPVSGIVPLKRFTADSYLYAPMMGIAGLFGTALEAGPAYFETRLRRHAVLWGLPAVAVVLLGCLAFNQQFMWRNTDALWTPLFNTHPNNLKVAEHYTTALLFQGREQEALAVFKAREKMWIAAGWMPHSYMPLLAKHGKPDKARKLFRWALRHTEYDRTRIQENFVRFLLNSGGTPKGEDAALAREALPIFVKSLAKTTTTPERLAHIARFSGDIGAFDIAEILLAAAVEKDPRPAFMEMGLAACRMQQKSDCETRWRQKKNLR